MVNIEGTEHEEKFSKKIPVAFSCAMFRIDQNGEMKIVCDKKEINVASTFAPTDNSFKVVGNFFAAIARWSEAALQILAVINRFFHITKMLRNFIHS